MNLSGFKRFIFAAAIIGLMGNAPAAQAANNGATLIDKGFEQALIKHFSKRIYSRIDASEEQRTRLAEIITRRADETRPLREQVRQEAVKLNMLMADGKSSDEEIMAQTQAVKSLRDKLMDQRVQTALQLRALLTQEQRQKIANRINGLLGYDRHN